MKIKLKNEIIIKNYPFKCFQSMECRGTVSLNKNNKLEIKCNIVGGWEIPCYNCCFLCKRTSSKCYKEGNGLDSLMYPVSISEKLKYICQLEKLRKYTINENKSI